MHEAISIADLNWKTLNTEFVRPGRPRPRPAIAKITKSFGSTFGVEVDIRRSARCSAFGSTFGIPLDVRCSARRSAFGSTFGDKPDVLLSFADPVSSFKIS